MKISKLLLCFPAIALLAFLSGCGGSGSAPERTAKAVIQATADKNVDKFLSLVDLGEMAKDKKSIDMLKPKIQTMLEKSAEELKTKGGLKDVKTKLVSQDATTAKVEVTSVFGNGTSESDTMNLKLVDGKWLVAMK